MPRLKIYLFKTGNLKIYALKEKLSLANLKWSAYICNPRVEKRVLSNNGFTKIFLKDDERIILI